jgi:hypothetical protein
MDPDLARTNVGLHPHAKSRLQERGATEEEIIATIGRGNVSPQNMAGQGSVATFRSTAGGIIDDTRQNRLRPMRLKKKMVGW